MANEMDIMRVKLREGGIMNLRQEDKLIKKGQSRRWAVPFCLLGVVFALMTGCGGNTNQGGANNDVIAQSPPSLSGGSPEGAWQSPADNLPINLQTDQETQEIASSATPPRNDNTIAPSDNRTIAPSDNRTIEPADYSGKVVIKFKDGTDVRLRPEDPDGPFITLRASPNDSEDESRSEDSRLADARSNNNDNLDTLAWVNEIVRDTRYEIRGVFRVMQASEEEVERWREDWARRGVTLHDWNLYYYLDVPEYEDAVALVKELNKTIEPSNNLAIAPSDYRTIAPVDYAEILPIFYLTSVTTPDMSNEQGYLKSASEGGLGVEDAWAKLDAQFPDIKLRGQNSMVVDQEYDWNFDHEILPIDETAEYIQKIKLETWQKYGTDDGKNIASNIHHGTAVAGIISAQGADIGKAISGIVPLTAMRVASMSDEGVLGSGTMFADDETPPGSILTIEIQQKGITTGSSGCSVGDGTSSPIVTGCVPYEASKTYHAAVTDSGKIGNIVIEGAGNGGVNLDDDNLAAPDPEDSIFSHFSDPDKDSGAIMVGASMGANRQKAAWSNCGSRVDVYAWGAGVVTAGYGDKYNPDGADPNTLGPMGADNPKLYTGQFGGTSAATAQIAGIAALVQSYVRQLVEAAGYEPKVVYLDSKQMRTILKNSGQPAVYGQTPNDPNPNCNIGVQPDMAKAIEETNEFLNAGNVLKVVPLNGNSNDKGGVVSGIRYDMDNDGRAELISFSRDHKWYIDLSGTPCTSGATCGDDGYGAWDVILDIPSPLGGEGQGEGVNDGSMLFPVVHDYNSDGRADLALYDSINGKYYIKYTSSSVIASAGGAWQSPEPIVWDRIIDYATDPAWKAYSRPVPGDYDGDYWLDPALQTPDGHWVIDYGGFDGVKLSPPPQPSPIEGEGEGGGAIAVQYLDHFGAFDKDVKYLTDEQLAQAPGWAWLPFDFTVEGQGVVSLKGPDNIDDNNAWLRLIVDGSVQEGNIYNLGELCNNCDNDVIVIAANYNYPGPGFPDYGLKFFDGIWNIYDQNITGEILNPQPNGIFGDVNCRPIPADYDGDSLDDRAVQCGTNWKIVYSSTNQIHEVELDQALDPIPAYIYPGGIKYQDTVDLYDYYKDQLGGIKNSTIFEAPPPIGPYFAQCVKYWAPNASYCWDK